MGMHDLVIIGGVTGGAIAATRVRRLNESVSITIFERGPQVCFSTGGLPYLLGGVVADSRSLMGHSPDDLKTFYNIDAHVNVEVTSINRTRHTITVHNLISGQSTEIPYDILLLSPGSEPVRPSFPYHEDTRVHFLHTLTDVDRLMAGLDQSTRKISIVGAGFLGLQAAEAVIRQGFQCTLAERSPHLLSALDPEMTGPLVEAVRGCGVALHLGDGIAGINGGDELELTLDSGSRFTSDAVIMALGVRPQGDLARKAGLEVSPDGAILVDRCQRTSDPEIYAIGDAVKVKHQVSGVSCYFPHAGPAARQAQVAADVICGLESAYKGTLGTAVGKMFTLTAGITGLTEKRIRALDLAYHRLYLHSPDHDPFYPEAGMVSFKLLFSMESRKILGAQIIGRGGVDKRLDVLSAAIQANMTVDELAELELGYSPPYGAVRDPLNMLGTAAQNLASDRLCLVEPEELDSWLGANTLLVDLREDGERERGVIPGSVNLPLSSLRHNAPSLLPRDKLIIVYCENGMRGYISQQFLRSKGWKVKSLNGGYLSWRAAQITGQCIGV